jgi:hypothetical protein
MPAAVVAGILIFEFVFAGFLTWVVSKNHVVVFQNPIDLATIVLAAAALVLAVATVILALITVWGMSEIVTRAELAAQGAARDKALEYLKGPDGKAVIRRETQDFVRFDIESGTDADADTKRLADELMKNNDNA